MNDDLMAWLVNAWEENLKTMPCTAPGLPTDHAVVIGEFVTFCREHLKGNPPVSVFMAIHGIGLKMTDGADIPILPQPKAEDEPLPQYMPVTMGGRDPMMARMADRNTVHVFGGKK